MTSAISGMRLVTTAWIGGMTGATFTATGAICGAMFATGTIVMRDAIAVRSGMTGTIYGAIVAICVVTGVRTADISITSGTYNRKA